MLALKDLPSLRICSLSPCMYYLYLNFTTSVTLSFDKLCWVGVGLAARSELCSV